VPLRTPLDGHISSMPAYLLAVAMRTLVALRRAPAARVAVASSHFFFDVVPAAALGRRHNAMVAAYVYHLVAESERDRSLRSWVSATLERLSLFLLRRAGDVIFVDNEETGRALLARGFREQQLTMTENAYDPLEPPPPPNRTDHPTVVFVGRLVEAKGVWEVIELARALRSSLPAARVSMMGDGPLRGELERVAASEDLDNVELVGFVSEAEKWRRLRSASLFVSPSREEGWGIAVGEALTAGVPAVVYDLPAYRHFGDLVIRVAPGDGRAFTSTAAELLSAPERLEQARLHLERHCDALPRWEGILAREFARMKLDDG
jgi:glycosyltransferase involved in cell wall biosynthesis